MNEQEEWRTAIGYEGIYEVSNQGRLRRSDGTLIPPYIDEKGYERHTLSKNGARNSVRLHRMVAMAFLPNPSSFHDINHINSVRCDNRVENLEWCTRKHNVYHGIRQGNVKLLRGRDSQGNYIRF